MRDGIDKSFYTVILLSFLLISLPLHGKAPSTLFYSKAVDEALQTIHMKRDDLVLLENYTRRDDFRLKAVSDCFHSVEKSSVIAEKIDGKIENSDPSETVSLFSSYLDYRNLEGKIPASSRIEVIEKIEKEISGELSVSLKKLIGSFLTGQRYSERALTNLNSEQREFIRKNLPTLFEEDSDSEKSLVEIKKDSYQTHNRVLEMTGILKSYRGRWMSSGIEKILGKALRFVSENSLSGDTSLRFEGDRLTVKIGGRGRNEYIVEEDTLIVDVSGNDVYKFKSFTGNSLVVDLSGKDVYRGKSASGFFGIGVVVDKSGDDIYEGADRTQGVGFLGAGYLLDMSGNDSYKADSVSQGAGVFGVGILEDRSGEDTYRSGMYSQGFGFTKGAGAVVERGGRDVYHSVASEVDELRYSDHYLSLSQGFGYGLRPYWSGGMGFIFEKGGNDVYSSDIYGQGAAYWFALGAVMDSAGNDHYRSYQYAQGSGIHFAFGVLLDVKGDDSYSSHGVSQGCGHDIGAGVLLDVEGEDYYTTQSLSQGGGNANAISVLIDGKGDDAYLSVKDNTRGYSDRRRGFGCVGLFLDLKGKETYGGPYGEEGGWWTHSTYGAGIDGDFDVDSIKKPLRADFELKSYSESGGKPEFSPVKPLNKEHKYRVIERIFWKASAALKRFRSGVKPARQKLIEKERKALPYLISRLSAPNVREQIALRKILVGIGEPALEPLIETAKNDQKTMTARKSAVTIIGRIESDKAIAPLIDIFEKNERRLKVAVMKALSRFDDPRIMEIAKSALDSSDPLLKLRAIQTASNYKDGNILRKIAEFTGSERYFIRYAAQEALVKAGKASFEICKDVLENTRDIDRQALLIEALGKIGDKRAFSVVKSYLESESFVLKAYAGKALINLGKKVEFKQSGEIHPFVKYLTSSARQK